MTIQERLTDAMKTAMKAQDGLRLNTIRMARTAIKNAEIEARGPLDDAAVIKVLSTLVKQRREAADAYRDTRPELAAKEEQELAILQEYLPSQMDEAEIKAIIETAVQETGATGPRDMGAVMKLVTPKTTGRADGRLVSELVKARLAG
ncbi:MAG: GatB/YqeY domain-containing protein [Deltaproteobacteria bacterium]|nr:MAG: GatB/YqeY domain-containing protein [Deltaproteobacteria bacterium]